MFGSKFRSLRKVANYTIYQIKCLRRLVLQTGKYIYSPPKLYGQAYDLRLSLYTTDRVGISSHPSLSKISFENVRLKKYTKHLLDTFSAAEAKLNEKSVGDTTQFRKTVNNLLPFVSLHKELLLLDQDLKELDLLIAEQEKQKDEDFLKAVIQERNECLDNIMKCQKNLMQTLIPELPTDDKDIIVEISAGVGGQEAMLFARELYDMYLNYAASKMWTCEIFKFDVTDIGGVKNANIGISGQNAYKILKLESGVHRVQRIPKTEKSGRVHTSTATVAVLPQPNEIDIVIHPKDIETEFKHSSGAGGQNVNKTESCVRLTHKPSGITVESQVDRFQYRNKEIAMKSLRAQLYERELLSSQKEMKLNRKLQVGSAGRSEKVRTYNFLQDRITDHRIHESFYDVKSFFQGNETLNILLAKLQTWSHVQHLNEILDNFEE